MLTNKQTNKSSLLCSALAFYDGRERDVGAFAAKRSAAVSVCLSLLPGAHQWRRQGGGTKRHRNNVSHTRKITQNGGQIYTVLQRNLMYPYHFFQSNEK